MPDDEIDMATAVAFVLTVASLPAAMLDVSSSYSLGATLEGGMEG